jgi:hypothetical protein
MTAVQVFGGDGIDHSHDIVPNAYFDFSVPNCPFLPQRRFRLTGRAYLHYDTKMVRLQLNLDQKGLGEKLEWLHAWALDTVSNKPAFVGGLTIEWENDGMRIEMCWVESVLEVNNCALVQVRCEAFQ